MVIIEEEDKIQELSQIKDPQEQEKAIADYLKELETIVHSDKPSGFIAVRVPDKENPGETEVEVVG